MRFTLKVGTEDQNRPRTIWRKLGTFDSIAEAMARAERHLATVYSRYQIEGGPSIGWRTRVAEAVHGCADTVYVVGVSQMPCRDQYEYEIASNY